MNTLNQPMIKITINNQSVVCNPVLADFEILKKASSNVDYFAIRRETSQFFIQFSNGKCLMYEGVPVEVLEEAKEAESIGKFHHAKIKTYTAEEIGSRLIVIDDLAEDEEESPFGIK